MTIAWLPWALLAAATACALIKRQVGLWLALSALVMGVATGVVAALYAFGLVLLAGLLHLTDRLPQGGRVWVHIATSLFVLTSALHLIPGTESVIVVADYQKSPDSGLYTLGLSFDKTIAPLALLILLPDMVCARRVPVNIVAQAFVTAGGTLALLSLSWGMGYIRPALAVPAWTWLFIVKMLCFTTFAEEVIFRGYLQNLMVKKWGAARGVTAAALLFGVAHFGGGVPYVMLASLAGLVYGLAYHLSGRLWVAIASHTALNTAHFVFFTLP
ncbi:MAG: CPBP family intramembrane metalloprotease [Kistimonas sp.]|nr:CPBP family intramembrane metalloprotease [Kistimonas sp.]